MATRKTHTCPQCERTLKRDAFGNDKARPDGRYRVCKECDHSNQRAWRERSLGPRGVSGREGEAYNGRMARDEHDRVGPKSWYWSNKTKVFVVAGVVIAFFVISVLLHPGGTFGDHP